MAIHNQGNFGEGCSCPIEGLGDDAAATDPTASSEGNASSDPGFFQSLWSEVTGDSSPSAPQNASPEAPSSPVTPSAPPPDPNELYSKYFTLKQLTVTSLPYPNLPLDQTSQDNLRKLATFLDAIQDNVGSFVIASAYRSPENQAALQSGAGGATAASMAVSHSYHSMGLAADITPKNGMTPTEFAQAIYQNPVTSAIAGQIVDKSEGGNETSLHISIQTPKFTKATPMYVVAGQYYRMTPTQIGDWMSSKMSDDAIATDSGGGEIVSDDDLIYDDSPSLSPALVLGALGAALAAYLLTRQMRAGKKPATS